jgi:cobalt/nickel transport system permease protein
MHIPDGFLSPEVSGATAGAVALAVAGAVALKRRDDRRHPPLMEEEGAPLLGVTAAFIFAAQMLNFPVAAGTSGHFMGSLLAVLLLGPGRGLLVMALVLGLQALLFADGGVLAYGANLFNMGVVGGWGGWLLYRLLRAPLPDTARGTALAAGIAAWGGLLLASAAAALELALSGTVALGLALPAMVGVHAIIGVGEALITSAALLAIAASRPDLLPAFSRGEIR